MTVAVSALEELDRPSPASSAQVASPCGSRVRMTSRHERWRHRSVELRSSLMTTGTRWGAPMQSYSPFDLPCWKA